MTFNVIKLTIIIQNGDLHDTCSAQLQIYRIFSGDHGKLQEKLFLWFPLVVINNCHSNLEDKI